MHLGAIKIKNDEEAQIQMQVELHSGRLQNENPRVLRSLSHRSIALPSFLILMPLPYYNELVQ